MAFLVDRVGNSINKDLEVPLLLSIRYTQLSIFWAHSSIVLLCLSEIGVVIWMAFAMKHEQKRCVSILGNSAQLSTFPFYDLVAIEAPTEIYSLSFRTSE